MLHFSTLSDWANRLTLGKNIHSLAYPQSKKDKKRLSKIDDQKSTHSSGFLTAKLARIRTVSLPAKKGIILRNDGLVENNDSE